MQVTIASTRLELLQGDITDQVVDAIVNAANSGLAGGGGVDGAIHAKGGPTIMEETRRLYPAGCPTGSAVISSGGRLKAKYVIHAVGPVWHGGKNREQELLAGAYRRSLELAAEHGCKSIALPALSTGAYGYPLEEGCRVAMGAVCEFARRNAGLDVVRFVLFNGVALAAFGKALSELKKSDGDRRDAGAID